MKHKGHVFKARAGVIVMPSLSAEWTPYIRFGKICLATAPDAEKICTWFPHPGDQRFPHPGEQALYAQPVKIKGYSGPNLAYGTDGRLYLLHEGVVYTSQKKLVKRAKPALE